MIGCTGTSLNISYFINLYPAVTHTFIRREINGLESLGHEVQRLSCRSDTGLVDEDDLDERQATTVFRETGKLDFMSSIFKYVCLHPARVFLASCFAAGYCIKRGVAPHRMAAYITQAVLVCINCRKHHADHLRVHLGGNAAVIARLAHRMGGPPFSIAYHGPDEFDAACRWDITGAVHESSFVTAISSDCKAKLCRWASPSDWERIHILRCSISQKFMQIAPFPSENQHRICVVSRLEAAKGLPLLLNALSKLSSISELPHVDIVGEGSMRNQLASMIADLNLDGHVHLCGALSGQDVKRKISSASAVLLPSFREGLPVSLMEAMALGRPVIASWCDGIPELVRSGVDGWTFAPGDADGLANALEQYLQATEEELIEMGEAGHQQACKLHSPKVLAEQLSKILVSGRTSSRAGSRCEHPTDPSSAGEVCPCVSGD